MARVHLAVGVELDDDLGAVGERPRISALHRPADPEVAPVVEDLDPGIVMVLQRLLAGGVGAAVVDDVDKLHFRADRAQHRADRRRGSK